MKCKTLALFLLLAMGCATRKPSLTPAQEVGTNSSAQDNSFLLDLMQHYPGYFDTLLQQNNLWKIKIIYTRIDRDQNNQPGRGQLFSPHHFALLNDPSTRSQQDRITPNSFRLLSSGTDLSEPRPGVINRNSTQLSER